MTIATGRSEQRVDGPDADDHGVRLPAVAEFLARRVPIDVRRTIVEVSTEADDRDARRDGPGHAHTGADGKAGVGIDGFPRSGDVRSIEFRLVQRWPGHDRKAGQHGTRAD